MCLKDFPNSRPRRKCCNDKLVFEDREKVILHLNITKCNTDYKIWIKLHFEALFESVESHVLFTVRPRITEPKTKGQIPIELGKMDLY